MNRVVVIHHESLIVQTERSFMLPQLIERGFEVEYWDISQLAEGGVPMTDTLERDYIRKIATLDQLARAVKATPIDDTLFVVEARECWENRELFSLLGGCGCYIIGINTYANIIPLSTKDRLRIFAQHPIRTLKLRINGWRYGRYKQEMGYTTYRDYFSSSSIDPSATKRLNHPDYERYCNSSAKQKSGDRYIVFIDNYFPEHPDIRYRLKCNGLDGERYRRSLIRHFERLERHYGMPVKVAAHPKAQYTPESFAGREIVKYRSEEMVIESSAVVLHTSNAVSFALLADRPIQFITNGEYRKCQHLQLMMERLARKLGCTICNIDNDTSYTTQQIDPSTRQEYINTYLTSDETKDRQNIDIISQYINEIERC